MLTRPFPDTAGFVAGPSEQIAYIFDCHAVTVSRRR